MTVRLLIAALSLLQHPRAERPDVRAGLDTLYGGGFPPPRRTSPILPPGTRPTPRP